MPVDDKYNILIKHSCFKMRLSHAAIGSFPCYSMSNIMTVNRVIIVFDDFGNKESIIRDPISGETFHMEPGNLYFIPCNYQSDWIFSENLLFVSLHFNFELFYGYDLFRDYNQFHTMKVPELAIEIKELLEQNNEITTLCKINEIIYDLCVKLLSMHPELERQRIGKWQKYEKIFDYLKNSCDATTTVEVLADMLAMRRDIFSRKFSKDMGITPKSFISSILVKKASEMLLESEILVKEVTSKLNFSSEYYFSHFFKRHTGISPKAYQKQMKNIL